MVAEMAPEYEMYVMPVSEILAMHALVPHQVLKVEQRRQPQGAKLILHFIAEKIANFKKLNHGSTGVAGMAVSGPSATGAL